MSTVIGKVAAVFTASTNGLVTGTNAASKAMNGMRGDVQKLHDKLTTLTTIQGAQLFGNLVSGAKDAVVALKSIGTETANQITEVQHLAEKLQIPAESLTALAEAGDEVGISQTTIATAVQKMGQSVLQLQNDVPKAIKSFEKLGLSAQDLEGLAPEEVFGKILDKIGALPTPAERTAAAIQVFGKAGKQLAPLFGEGTAAIKAAIEETTLFGNAIDDVSGGHVVNMQNAFKDLGDIFDGFKKQILVAFAPAVVEGMNAAFDGIKNAGGIVPVSLKFAEIMAVSVGNMIDGAMIFAKILMDAAANFNTIWTKIKGVGQGIYATGEMVGAGLVGGVATVAGGAEPVNKGTLADNALTRSDVMQAEAGSLFNRAYANLFGSGENSMGGAQISAGGQFTSAALKEIERLREINKERLDKARGASATTPTTEGVSSVKSEQEKSLKTWDEMAKELKTIASNTGKQAESVIFAIPGAGAR
jgi:hypothetical protein